MPSFLYNLRKYFSPNRKPFACESEDLIKVKDTVSLTEQSFVEIYNQTRELAGDIINKLEENRKR